MSRGRTARQALRRHLNGTLSTHSKKFAGYPYGSAVPHMTDWTGCPIILISHLAEHTHNIEADPRVGFLVAQAGPDLQSHGRVSILGDAQPIEHAALRARYLRYHPDAERSLAIGGFTFFRILPAQVRVIEGFGTMHWIAGDSFLAQEVVLDAAEVDILEHMNTDHSQALQAYCKHTHNVHPGTCSMIGIDQDGFDVRADADILRFDFAQPVTTPAAARQALVDLAEQARA
jgi:heme iron utilization protein